MYIIIFIILLFALFMVFQAGHLKREYFTLNDGKLELRIAFISDLHMGLLLVSEKEIKKALHEEKPDIFIIAGDIIDREKHISDFTKLIRNISPKCPVFAVLGNHDHGCFEKNPLAKDLFFFNTQSLGIEILINKCITFHKGGKIINIIGIDDERRGKPDVKVALSQKNTDADLTLCIAHNPETALSIPEGEIDLLLCGHFHGGQIWMPLNFEYRLLRSEKTCKAGYRKGYHVINGVPTYISRGIGNVVVPFRFGSRPEITFIDL